MLDYHVARVGHRPGTIIMSPVTFMEEREDGVFTCGTHEDEGLIAVLDEQPPVPEIKTAP